MSIRPEVSGFDLVMMFRLFGSKDLSVLKETSKKLKKMYDLENNEFQECEGILRQAIMQGIPFSDLKTETNSHVWSAIVLADYNQKHLGTDSNIWGMDAVWDLGEKIGKTLPWPSSAFFNYLRSGRPLFGGAIDTDWSHYAFLSHAENAILCKSLRELEKLDEGSQETRDKLLQWLSVGLKEKKDIWFYTQ